MEEVCALCNVYVGEGTAKAKRLRLFGDSAVDTREQMDMFLYQELGVRLEETDLKGKSWLCYKCRNEVDRYFQIIQDINKRREQLLEKFSGIAFAMTEPLLLQKYEQRFRKRASEEQTSSLAFKKPNHTLLLFLLQLSNTSLSHCKFNRTIRFS